eukprot:CAMPEP_0116144978 /NCGR_PEP_ID=MMETSP0329-20121206/16322_1 /TAXON_ID=697910 /ORGANISM="Pseudo-nitzschia arenysensis, Strain B593" /LENGTH=1028 /DNA_ID=CAMNT_0003640501 /DNA_START=11 /DNA_END=3094 /DNA_ORIENTATION=-
MNPIAIPSATAATATEKAAANEGKAKNPPIKAKKPVSVRTTPRQSKREVLKQSSLSTVGYHDESETNSNSNSSRAKKQPLSDSTTTITTPSRYPPLVSRYCGCCGDILSTKAYGFDKDGRDRRLAFHPYDRIGTIERTKLQEGAEAIKQNLIKGKSKSSKSTKASRKKKKLAARNAALYMEIGPNQHDFVRGLDPWPEEAIEMDMTILEGLISLKTAPLEEVGCRCWRADTSSSSSKLAAGKAVSPNGKTRKLKLATTNKFTAGKTKVIPKKKASALAKGAGSLTSSNGVTTEVVSTKTTIVKCPKTGKKIKKTVRVVKKLVKKKLSKTKAIPGLAGAVASGKLSDTAAGATAALSNNNNKTKIPSFSVLGAGQKDPSSLAQGKSKAKKRSLHEDDEDGGSCSDDTSDEGGSSLKKRRRNDEKADLDLRERLMNCQLENGPIFPSQQELMELTTIRKRNALQTFYKRFNELRQFIAIFGDANVPQQFPENHSLGIWVNKMRMERKKWDTGSERTSLTERKIELLESIEFIWAQNHKGEIGWERRFQEIRKFKRKHGHCNVPTKSAENRALGRWVSTQRTMYKNYMKGFVGKSLTREEQERRIFLLLKEGFLFSMIPNGQSPNGAGGEQQTNEEGVGNEDSTNEVVTTAAAPLETHSSVERKTMGAAIDFSNPDISTDTPVPVEKPAPVTETSNLIPTISSSETKEAAKDSSNIGASDMEPKESKSLVDANNGDKDKTDISNESPPLSPSRTKDALPTQSDGIAQASSPPPVPGAPSIAQVSVTTTPTTTPSVSTVASPDRSSSGDEPENEKGNIVEETGNETTIDEMPVAPSLASEPISNHLSNAQTKLASTPDATLETNSLPVSSPVAVSVSTRQTISPAKEKTKSPKANGKSPTKDISKRVREESPISKKTTAKAIVSTPKSSPKEKPAQKTSSSPPKTPLRSKSPNTTTTTTIVSSPKPRELITSDGLRIIVKYQDDGFELSPRSHNIADASAPSPSRRSVRARKPSARQLEAEKSPLVRESILG